jgi:hypothetical protein
MRGSDRWIVVVPIVAGLQLSACQPTHSGAAHVAPAHVEKIEGTGLSKVTLTARAAERLGIETAAVGAFVVQAGAIATPGDASGARLQGDPRSRVVRSPASGSQVVVPYAAVLYDAHGDTWVYTSPEPLVFIRHKVKIDYIEGNRAVLSEGPAVGMNVVTIGAAELLGTEFEVGH